MVMETRDFLKKRILELAERAGVQGIKTHTMFLGEDAQSLLDELVGEKRACLATNTIGDAHFFFFGGNEEAERKMLFFLPDYLDIEEEKKREEDGENIACLHVAGKKVEFAEELSHRDVLGALMSLGYEREQFGDILVAGKEAYVFLASAIAPEVFKNLLSIRHTVLKNTLIAPRECPWHRETKEILVNVMSPRLDAVVGEVCSFSREQAQSHIEKGEVLLDGVALLNSSHLLKGGERIAVRGWGKFLYLGEEKLSRKGRLFVKVKVFL